MCFLNFHIYKNEHIWSICHIDWEQTLFHIFAFSRSNTPLLWKCTDVDPEKNEQYKWIKERDNLPLTRQYQPLPPSLFHMLRSWGGGEGEVPSELVLHGRRASFLTSSACSLSKGSHSWLVLAIGVYPLPTFPGEWDALLDRDPLPPSPSEQKDRHQWKHRLPSYYVVGKYTFYHSISLQIATSMYLLFCRV